ncbi:hypothetical protein DH2020_035368 [Rehmannia glutinosa]|uniref:Uncharacterized protein n=1 Tax=Rehmannia glutinosa TaxID=99300 RepID=A0ABR0V8J4_REHGL
MDDDYKFTIHELSSANMLLMQDPIIKRWCKPNNLIYGVQPALRLWRQQNDRVYDPIIVSPALTTTENQSSADAEEDKYCCLDWFAGGNQERKTFLHNQILQKIDVIRSCYADATIVEKYDDHALAMMMLLDACLILYFMGNDTNIAELEKNMSSWLAAFMPHDIMLLENQIPYMVLKLLIGLLMEDDRDAKADEIIESFARSMMGLGPNPAHQIPGEYVNPPIHILEAFWRVSVENPNRKHEHEHDQSELRCPRSPTRRNMTCRSVTDLRAKGICFGPSSSCSLSDITFDSHAFYGQLRLPLKHLNNQSQTFFCNAIAYEASPNSTGDTAVLSYVKFMKSLLQSSEDVKELRKRGILTNALGDNEQVVEMFRGIDTFDYSDVFEDVRLRIEEHCRSKAKTWVADVIHSVLRTPWTASANLRKENKSSHLVESDALRAYKPLAQEFHAFDLFPSIKLISTRVR